MILDAPPGSGPDEQSPPALTVDTDADAPRGDRTLELVQQCAWSVVWLGVLSAGLAYWGSWTSGGPAAALAPLLTLVGLVGSVLVWTDLRPVSALLQWSGLGASLVTLAVVEGTGIHGRHYYSTDSAAFNQVATRLLLDGHDPYTSSMAAATRLLHPAADFWTYQVDGAHTLGVSYPAGSFLLQAPVMALGATHMVSDWVDLAAWLVTGVLMFCMLPRALRWLAPMLLLTGHLRRPLRQRGHRRPVRALPGRRRVALGPVAGAGDAVAAGLGGTGEPGHRLLGQTDPVVLRALPPRRRGLRGPPVGEGAMRDGLASAARYGAIVVATFLVVNLPFLVWSPSAWLKGTFLPMVDPLVADGQGVVALALHGLTGGVVLPWLSAAAGLALVVLLIGFALWEPRLRRAWLFLVPLVLFLPDRSLANYLSDFVPAALIAAASIAPSVTTSPGWAERRPWPAAPGGRGARPGAAVLVVVALTSAPLEVTVDRVGVAGVATVDGGQWFRTVDVSVRNTSDHALRPLFTVSSGGRPPVRLLARRRWSGATTRWTPAM